jgi:hypothetical protein
MASEQDAPMFLRYTRHWEDIFRSAGIVGASAGTPLEMVIFLPLLTKDLSP